MNLLQFSYFDSTTFPNLELILNSSLFLNPQLFFDHISSILLYLKNLQFLNSNQLNSLTIIQLNSLKDLLLLIQSCFLPICDLILSLLPLKYTSGILKILNSCLFSSPKLQLSSTIQIQDEEFKLSISMVLNEILTRIINIQTLFQEETIILLTQSDNENNEDLLSLWLQSILDSLK